MSTAAMEGDPRPAEPVPLESARDLGIRQVLTKDGQLAGDLADPELPRDEIQHLYESMVLLRAIDERGWKLQRSGRIAFWIPMRGQEGVQVGAVHGMHPTDWVFRGHREMAPWLMRGGSLERLFEQFFGSAAEPQKGRRLPCLIGSREVDLVSSTTQVGSFIAHACGAGWGAKLKGLDTRVLCVFGDGGTSRGEFHSAMNFAGIHKPPVVFVCVNNGWAVTTPLDRQTAQGDFAAKGNAYNVRNLRVDGNDPLAMYAVTREARDGTGEFGATLIEAVTYRIGFHTSSDNPDLYRQHAETEQWAEWDPIKRLRCYMEDRDWWSADEDEALRNTYERRIQSAVTHAEAAAIPGPESQFDDVYAESNWMLDAQKQRLLDDLDAGAA